MTPIIAELNEIQEDLQKCIDTLASKEISAPLKALENSAATIGNAASGSWFGYHSLVYHKDLKPPPAGTHFSVEWGLMDTYAIQDTSGNWIEYAFDRVKEEITSRAGSPDLSLTREASAAAKERFEERLSQFISILETQLAKRADTFLQRILDDSKKITLMTASNYIAHHKPGHSMSRDSLAITQGLKVPPHISILADIHELESPGNAASKLKKIVKQATAHLERLARDQDRAERIGTNVFIGHGRSRLWKDLKDFIQDRLHLPWDEFNRVPVAGITNISRLSEMLDSAAVALVIMTAEDEQADGKVHARMNVVHEVGLFQGRLGFTKAIVLLEEGCEEFSNINGIGQIRFPKGNISAAFEEIRQVLEREGLLDSE